MTENTEEYEDDKAVEKWIQPEQSLIWERDRNL